MKILDGTGQGHHAKVTATHRLETSSVTRSEHLNAAENQDAYFIPSSHISLTTTASFSGVIYLLNTDDRNFHMYSIRTCNDVVCQWNFYKNPTTGTLISGGTLVAPENADFGSATLFTGEARYGADALTVTDGSVFAQHINDVGHTTMEPYGAIILRKNDAFAVTAKPASAGTVCVTILGYYAEEEG